MNVRPTQSCHTMARIRAGEFIRISALGIGAGESYMVHVLFQGPDCLKGFVMQSETYDAIPLLVDATPDDYRKHGELTEAAPSFDCHYAPALTAEPLRRPQAQLFPDNEGGFCLVAEKATDGARIIREREEKEANQKQEAQKQKELFV